ncbi:ATP-binding cassette domain-containing protein [Micromonospora sp. DT4]|uniref:ATP-binding cassette domain-containing protein n=1 Tax=Micromonospora sp. DT4 TaxID=3393438 RepID=UPI003CF1BAC6
MTLVRLDAVGRRYGGLRALHDVSLILPAGARHAVIGANGAGKSTLFGIIAGSVRPTSGRVLLDGHDVTRLGPAARARRGIGRTFQHPAVFGRLSAAANVALAISRRTPPGARSGRIRCGAVTDHAHAVLATAGLAGYTHRPAATLPYGVRRRLELVVALATAPRLLLLDEPSAGLDPGDLAQLVQTIRALPPDVTVLLIDHHLDLVWDVADTVTVLHHGHHIATGTPDAIRADSAVQAAYLTTTPEAPAPPTARPHSDGRRPLLRVRGLRAGYHGAPAAHDVDLDLSEGQILALLGRNGAGKTTVLNALAGLVPFAPPTTVTLGGRPLPADVHRIAQARLNLVPQGRRLFNLSVAEHLTVARASAGKGSDTGHRWSRDHVLALLPALRARLGHHAAHLSGGEQQMLALARALLAHPRVLLLDEPSEGLAPAVVRQIAAAITAIAAHGVGVVIAEQNLPFVLPLADHVVVLEHGQVALTTATAHPAEPLARRLGELLGVTPTGAGHEH